MNPPGSTSSPTAMVSWAHRPDPDITAQAWEEQVVNFVFALRECDIDADVDLFHLSETGIDWTRWGPQQVTDSAWVLIVVNAAMRERIEGRNSPTEGAGAVAEMNAVKSLFERNQEEWAHRVVLVLLPGSKDADIPTGMHGIHRRWVTSFDAAGLEDLLRLLTGQPRYVKNPLGRLPPLPAHAMEELRDVVADPEQLSPTTTVRTSDGTAAAAASAHAQTASAPVVEAEAHLDTERSLTATGQEASVLDGQRSTLETLIRLTKQWRAEKDTSEAPEDEHSPQPTDGEGDQGVPEVAAALLTEVLRLVDQRDAAAARAANAAPSSMQLARADAETVLARQLTQIAPKLLRDERCWLVLATAPMIFPTAGPVSAPATGARERVAEVLRTYVQDNAPPVTMSNYEASVRDVGRVIINGSADPARTAQFPSGHWRLELGDGGEGIAAVNMLDRSLRARQDLGLEVVDLARAGAGSGHAAQLRRYHLETWLLVQLQVLAAHARASAAAAGVGEESLMALGVHAYLLLPEPDGSPLGGTASAVVPVDPVTDEDGHHRGVRPCPGARALPTNSRSPETETALVEWGWLDSPRSLARRARDLSIRLLEHFGVEDTAIISGAGMLDELAAGEGDRQGIWEYARRQGLALDGPGPAERRERYLAFLVQARDQWRR